MKKALLLTLVLAMVLSIVGCGGSTGSGSTPVSSSGTSGANSSESSPATNWPNKAITMLVPWSAGGGSDLAVRTLMPYVEKELGTSVTVVNETGANGWIAWTNLAKAKPDGYTMAQLNIPAFYSGYLDPQQQRDLSLDDFLPIANEISDWGCMVVKGGDSRFSTAKELIDYGMTHELLAGDNGAGTNKHLLAEMIKAEFEGVKITPVHQKGWSDSYAALLGGHIDIGWGSIGECLQGMQDGELDVLCVFASERSSLMPDVPTFNELNLGAEILSPADRGFVLPAGVDPAIYDKIVAAFKVATENPEFVQKMEALGQAVNYIGGQAYQNYVKEQEQVMITYSDVLGWKK